jgi:hypothetical protein
MVDEYVDSCVSADSNRNPTLALLPDVLSKLEEGIRPREHDVHKLLIQQGNGGCDKSHIAVM